MLKDELLLSHFSVARTVDTMPEQAVLGFLAWCGLEFQAAALAGMNLRTGKVGKSARLPPLARATIHWVPPDPMPAPMIEGWGAHCEHTVDAAQTFVVCLLASLRTVEMKRSHVQDLRLRDDSSTAVVGFCAGGKSPKGLADRQPFYWFVDSNMGVNGTTNLWLYAWATKRLGKGWIFPDYTLKPKQEHACAPWQRTAKEYWLIAGVWNKLLSLVPICLSEQDRTAARSTPYCTSHNRACRRWPRP